MTLWKENSQQTGKIKTQGTSQFPEDSDYGPQKSSKKMKPRIYTYKITFEEIPHWYWGVHKEKKFNESYSGSPVTHAWIWEFYTPTIQILEFFPYSDEGWVQARMIEQRLIRPDLNHSLCLNEACGGIVSMEILRQSGYKAVKEQTGVHNPDFIYSDRSREYRIKNCLHLKEEKKGLFKEGYLGSSEHRETSRSGGLKAFSEKKGFFAEYIGSELHIEKAKEFGEKCVREGVGWFSPEAIAKRSKRISVQFPDGRVEEFPSIREAAQNTGLSHKTVKRLAETGISGVTYKTKGFYVSFA